MGIWSRISRARAGPVRTSSLPKWILLAILCAACNPARGCAESRFDLAPESRLPKWFTLPPRHDRADVTVKMTYYIAFFGGSTATFVLFDRDGRKIAEVEGSIGSAPLALTPIPPSGPLPYPLYQIATINGISELIEHRRREPVFVISDDADVKRQLRVPQP
jgi:hypothetical protein